MCNHGLCGNGCREDSNCAARPPAGRHAGHQLTERPPVWGLARPQVRSQCRKSPQAMYEHVTSKRSKSRSNNSCKNQDRGKGKISLFQLSTSTLPICKPSLEEQCVLAAAVISSTTLAETCNAHNPSGMWAVPRLAYRPPAYRVPSCLGPGLVHR